MDETIRRQMIDLVVKYNHHDTRQRIRISHAHQIYKRRIADDAGIRVEQLERDGTDEQVKPQDSSQRVGMQ